MSVKRHLKAAAREADTNVRNTARDAAEAAKEETSRRLGEAQQKVDRSKNP